MFRMEDIRAELLPHLVELAADEECSVRLAAFDTIINLMEMMDNGESSASRSLTSPVCLKPPTNTDWLWLDDRLHVAVPLMMSVCGESSQMNEAMVASLSFQFGKLCSGLAGETGIQRSVCSFSEAALQCGEVLTPGLMSVCFVSGSLSDEQKAQLLERFKVLCVAGLQPEENQTNDDNESTLIRCNCCYNFPVNHTVHRLWQQLFIWKWPNRNCCFKK